MLYDRLYTGIVSFNEKGTAFANPLKRHLPRAVLKELPEELVESYKASAHYVRFKYFLWDKEFTDPKGRFENVLGPLGHFPTESQVALDEAGITQEDLTADEKEELTRLTKRYLLNGAGEGLKLQKEDMAGRRDLREMHSIFTIDSSDAKCLDDALSIERLNEEVKKGGAERFRIGIYIADPTHFIEENGPLDKLMLSKGTTIYLNKCINEEQGLIEGEEEKKSEKDRKETEGEFAWNMMPDLFADVLCSLLPGEDRLAVALTVVVSADGEVDESSVDVFPALIRSKMRLTYDEASAFIKSAKDADLSKDPLLSKLCETLGSKSPKSQLELINALICR